MFYYNKSKFQLGICIPLSRIFEAKKFDFLELSLTEVMYQSEKEFLLLKKSIEENKISVLVMNCLFPRNLPIVGENLNIEMIKSYSQKAIKRAYGLGCKLLVLGSGSSRKYMAEYGKQIALYNFKEVLLILQEQAEKYSISIAIEPICSIETNLLNTMEDVYKFIVENKISRIKMICDIYHLEKSLENLKDIEKYIDLIEHFHIAGKDRLIPYNLDENLKSFFELIESLNYKKLISIEANLSKEDPLLLPDFLQSL